MPTAAAGFFGKLPCAGDFVQRRLPGDFVEEWDLDSFFTALEQLYPTGLASEDFDPNSITKPELIHELRDDIVKAYEEREEELGEELMRGLERFILLQIIDERWREHLHDMDYLREGIHLRGFAQEDPLVAYKNEAFNMFGALIQSIWEEFARYIFNVEIEIEPAPLAKIECIERGTPTSLHATAVVSGIPFDVAERELKTARKLLADWPEEAFAVRQLPADQGPGTVLLLEAGFEHITEVMSGFGKLGVSAERLATTAVRRIAGYIASSAFVGPYLQDQILLPFAMAGGGTFTTVKLSEHTLTAARLIERFTGIRTRVREQADGCQFVEVVA